MRRVARARRNVTDDPALRRVAMCDAIEGGELGGIELDLDRARVLF
jgi:hypothetical protein